MRENENRQAKYAGRHIEHSVFPLDPFLLEIGTVVFARRKKKQIPYMFIIQVFSLTGASTGLT